MESNKNCLTLKPQIYIRYADNYSASFSETQSYNTKEISDTTLALHKASKV